ncbi:MAG: polysaccharide export outer membrane protein [Planctomycetota bacterium]|jgi:polysaccharide export outer membrane protein
MRSDSPILHPHVNQRTLISSALSCTLVLLAACAAVPLPESTTDIDTRSNVADWSIFKLGPGDRVHLAVYGHGDFTTPEAGVTVSPAGTLSVPLLGAVAVEGKSSEQVRDAIEAGLATYLVEPSVTLWVSEYSSRSFHLLGDFEQPGPFVMDRPLNALEAVSMGKGIRAGGNRELVVILRAHGEGDIEVIPFNVRTPGPDGLVQIQPDDVIFVSKSGVGRFSEKYLPYLQGVGFSLSQATSLALVAQRF